jgi:hypothetical protein
MTEQVQNPEVAQAPAEGEAQTPATPDLTVNDLQALKTIIDVCTQRGAFRANELSNVGAVFNRLSAFLDHIAPQQKEGAPAEAPKQ